VQTPTPKFSGKSFDLMMGEMMLVDMAVAAARIRSESTKTVGRLGTITARMETISSERTELLCFPGEAPSEGRSLVSFIACEVSWVNAIGLEVNVAVKTRMKRSWREDQRH
jgi:hypothetical protein